MERHSIELALPEADAVAALAAAAEEWGAEWTPDRGGGRLAMPVVFGLRRGVLVGRIEVLRSGAGVRLDWRLEESHLELHRASVAVLTLAAVALVGTTAWPFHPPLLAFVPFAAVLGLLTWWLVVSRLRNSGPEDFLATVAAAGAAPD